MKQHCLSLQLKSNHSAATDRLSVDESHFLISSSSYSGFFFKITKPSMTGDKEISENSIKEATILANRGQTKGTVQQISQYRYQQRALGRGETKLQNATFIRLFFHELK